MSLVFNISILSSIASFKKIGAVLVSVWLCVFSTVAVADTPPPPMWHTGGSLISSTAIETCQKMYIEAKIGRPLLTSYNVINTAIPTTKICQVWEASYAHNWAVNAQCFFNGRISGGSPSHGATVGISVVAGAPACVCPANLPEYDSKFGVCRDASQASNITLTGPSETRPVGTGGTSEITLTAKVTDGTNPKPGVALSFSVDVTAKSGGHDHEGDRPKGTLSLAQGTTDANGEVKLTFKAPEIAGIHTVKANCATCSSTVVTKEVQVKVPDLLPISPNPPLNADGTFVYALTSVDKTHQGNGRYHLQQYYLTEQSRQNLDAMISDFAAEGWGTVALNDASLFWGGRYDIYGNWGQPTAAKEPHAGHREGREIDVSFARAGNPISASKQKVFYKKFCETKTVQASFSILHHFVKNPHFHVYLEKQTACWKSEK